MTTRKLKHYFLAHSVRVVSDRPLAHVLQSKEATWWIAQWAVEISHYDVEFIPWWAFKFQALVDFIVEWIDSGLRGIDELPDHFVMYFNVSYTLKGAGDGVVLIPPEGDVLKYAIQLEFLATNNIVEYEGLVTFDDSLSREIRSWSPKQVQKEYHCNN
jgi:hypothetical protein